MSSPWDPKILPSIPTEEIYEDDDDDFEDDPFETEDDD